MNSMKTGRLLRSTLLLLAVLALTACGFHLRRNAPLPPSMQRMHLNVHGGGDLQRHLARALRDSGVTVEDDSGPGVAELNVPSAAFSTDTLSAGGYVRITEYAVRYQVHFNVSDAAGQALVPTQSINMSREYSYDARNTVGNASQVEALKQSLNSDMVQAILFRLQAAGKRMQGEQATPAPASSTP